MRVRFHRSMLRAGACIGVVSIVFLVAGCGPATPPAGAPAPQAAAAQQAQERVKQRVEARWARMIARDFVGAYAFETPAYRATVDPKQYASQFGAAVNWISATVAEVAVDPAGDRATVEVAVQFQTQAPLGGGLIDRVQPLAEHWILADGDWWVVRDGD